MGRKYEIIERDSGRKIVIINDAIFKKKKYIGWKEVKEYLKKYVGEYYTILSVDEKVYIGSNLLTNLKVQYKHDLQYPYQS